MWRATKRAVGNENKQLRDSSGNYCGGRVARMIAAMAAATVAMA